MERTVFDDALVLDSIVERTILDAAHGRIVDRAVEGAAVDDTVILDFAVEGAVVDGAVVLDFVVERTVFDHALVLDRVLERAIHDAARSHIVDLAVEGAAQNAAVVEHFAVELAARDGRRLAHKDVALHRRTISDGAEIEQPAGLVAARQKQHVAIGRVIFNVLPAVALAGVFAAVGILRPAVLHDEVGAGDRFVQHHVIVRHGKGHGRLVAAVVAVAVARNDGLAVQAEDFGVGSDGHGGACVGVEVPCRAGRHGSRRFIHLQRVFAVHLEHTAIRYGDVVGIGQPRLAVDHAAGHVAAGRAGPLKQARREGAAGDGAADLIEHYVPEHAVLDGAAFVQDSAGHGFEGAGLFRWGRIPEVVGPLLQNQGSSVDDIPSVTLAGFVSIVGLVVHMLQIHRAVCIHQQAGTERLIVCRQGQLAAGDIGHHERERLFAGQVHCATVIVPKFDAFRRDGPAHKVLGLILRGHFHLAADEHTTAAFGRLAAFDFAAHNFQFSRAVQHHGLARHGEFHGRLVVWFGVAAVVDAPADGLVVQAVDFGAGGDGHGGVFVRVEVPCRVGRSIRVQRAFAVHLAYTAIRYGDVVGTGQVCVPVEYAAEYFAAVVLRQARRKGSIRDRSVVVFHVRFKGAAGNCHTRFNLNRTRHRRCGRCSLGLALGMGGTEIKRSIQQSQCPGVPIVTPVVADILSLL